MASPSLDALAEAYGDRGVQSVFVFVREAHPGEYFPHHDSIERKFAHAREFRRLFGIQRPILVDDLAGTAHAAYGRLPNMTSMLRAGHTVAFRADWTDAPTVRVALDYLLDVRQRRHEGLRSAPFVAELQGARWVDQAAFDAGLAHNGPITVARLLGACPRARIVTRSVERPGIEIYDAHRVEHASVADFLP
jgi:hypothetical protein